MNSGRLPGRVSSGERYTGKALPRPANLTNALFIVFP